MLKTYFSRSFTIFVPLWPSNLGHGHQNLIRFSPNPMTMIYPCKFGKNKIETFQTGYADAYTAADTWFPVKNHMTPFPSVGGCKKKYKTRGPWWSYIAHLTKQICIFTVEVSAKFTALGFLYKLYGTNHPQPPPPHPPGHVFLQILTTWTES